MANKAWEAVYKNTKDSLSKDVAKVETKLVVAPSLVAAARKADKLQADGLELIGISDRPDVVV